MGSLPCGAQSAEGDREVTHATKCGATVVSLWILTRPRGPGAGLRGLLEMWPGRGRGSKSEHRAEAERARACLHAGGSAWRW